MSTYSLTQAEIAPPCTDRKQVSDGYRVPPPITHSAAAALQSSPETAAHSTPLAPDTLPGCLQAFLSRNLGERITLKDLSRFLGYSEKYASEFFRSQMGVCFSHHLKGLRVTKATRMLSDHRLSIAHIAESLGFSDSFAFSHFFKRAVGCSPTEFRKQHTAPAGFR